MSANRHSWACPELPMKMNGCHLAHLELLMKMNGCHLAHLELPMKMSSCLQARLALPMKTNGHQQLCLAYLMSICSYCPPRKALAQKCRGGSGTGAEKMGVLLPIPLQASTGKSTTK